MRRGQWRSFSICGLLLGTLFFGASLTPTLLPRNFLTQGVLSGCSLAAGYGIGVFGRWLWAYMELPQPKGGLLRVAKLACFGLARNLRFLHNLALRVHNANARQFQ